MSLIKEGIHRSLLGSMKRADWCKEKSHRKELNIYVDDGGSIGFTIQYNLKLSLIRESKGIKEYIALTKTGLDKLKLSAPLGSIFRVLTWTFASRAVLGNYSYMLYRMRAYALLSCRIIGGSTLTGGLSGRINEPTVIGTLLLWCSSHVVRQMLL